MNKKEKDSFEFIKNKNLLPFHLKEDLEKSNFLVIFVNQRSGSQEGTIIMELAKKYHHSSIKDFNILTFPIISNLIYSKTTSNLTKTNNNNNNHNNNIHYKKIEYEEKEIFSIIVFDILDKYDYQHGINFVKDYLNNYKSNNIKIIIGGGDGTILRLIEELKKNDIIMERCIFGSMPLGTGNDLSNSLGFGAEVNINYSINRLQKILYNYLIAKIIKRFN
jgi:diacylglycerol kinase (ATP)